MAKAHLRRSWSDRLAKGDAQRIRMYLCDQVGLARSRGDNTVTFRAGDVHKVLGLEPRMPNVCQVLEGRKFQEEAMVSLMQYIECPPSGQGANLTIKFRIL